MKDYSSKLQSIVLLKKPFDNLVRNGLKARLQPDERIYEFTAMGIYRLRVKLSIQCYKRKTMETIRKSSDKQSRRRMSRSHQFCERHCGTRQNDRGTL